MDIKIDKIVPFQGIDSLESDKCVNKCYPEWNILLYKMGTKEVKENFTKLAVLTRKNSWRIRSSLPGSEIRDSIRSRGRSKGPEMASDVQEMLIS